MTGSGAPWPGQARAWPGSPTASQRTAAAHAGEPGRRRHVAQGSPSVRIVIAEDSVLLREGLAGLLEDAGHEVVARVGDGVALLAAVAENGPDLAVVDVRMPPGYQDEGMIAAATLRRAVPATAGRGQAQPIHD